MDAKITLSFDSQVIKQAKEFAKDQGLSLSRLMEIMLRKATAKKYESIEDLPIADWVRMVSEGKASYVTRSRSKKDMKAEFFESKGK